MKSNSNYRIRYKQNVKNEVLFRFIQESFSFTRIILEEDDNGDFQPLIVDELFSAKIVKNIATGISIDGLEEYSFYALDIKKELNRNEDDVMRECIEKVKSYTEKTPSNMLFMKDLDTELKNIYLDFEI